VVDSTACSSTSPRRSRRALPDPLPHAPRREFPSVLQAFTGTGFPGVERMDDIWRNPEFDAVDLWRVPRARLRGGARAPRALGKRVFGAGPPRNRSAARAVPQAARKARLDVPPYEVVEGVTALREHLKKSGNVWIKLPRWRRDRENPLAQATTRIFRCWITSPPVGPSRRWSPSSCRITLRPTWSLGADLICVDGMTPTHA